MTQSLATELAQFTGTEKWYRAINPRVTYTEGVKYFADTAGAHWLIDIIATELAKPCRIEGFLSIKAVVTGTKAKLIADDGNGKIIWQRAIGYTDCPEGEWKFFLAPEGPQETLVLLLPSEY